VRTSQRPLLLRHRSPQNQPRRRPNPSLRRPSRCSTVSRKRWRACSVDRRGNH